MKKTIKIIGIVALAFVLVAAAPLYNLLSTSYLGLNFLSRVKDLHYENAAYTLNNPDASQEAKDLMGFLSECYGESILSGQYIDTYQNYSEEKFLDENGNPTILKANELVALTSVNGGKLPAVVGFDFSGVESEGQWDNYVTRLATQWHNLGGIVTFCWHWLVPEDISSPRGRWENSTMYASDTNFSLSDVLADKNGELYKMLLRDIDLVSEQLAILRDAGVPVLWRPLHEAAGGWFWWGASGKDAYIELYNLMYDIMTNEKGLNNLIWVFNAQKKDWYVGDDRADIVADDPYPINNIKELSLIDSARANRFKYHESFAGNKMIAMSEIGSLPGIDGMYKHNTKWLFFCTWMREFVVQSDPDDQPYGMTNKYSEEYTSVKTVQKVYGDPRVLALEDLLIK